MITPPDYPNRGCGRRSSHDRGALRIFEVNDKDLIGSIALLLSRPVAPGYEPGINRERHARTAGTDWGWFTTVPDNLAKAAARLPTGRPG